MTASHSRLDAFASVFETSPSEPQDLVARAAAGDAQATRLLVETLMPDAYRVAVTVLGPKHPDLEDAVQLGVVAVMKQLAAFRGESSFRGFAMLIVSRTATAVRRKRKRGVELTEKLRASEARDDAELPTDPAEPPDQGLRRVLTELLATLPDVQAETFLLRVVLEYDVAEVAAETGAAVNTVRSRLRLAREALRRRIDADPRLAELRARERTLATTSNERADDE